MAVAIIIFNHCQHEDAQFHCSWWGIFNETVCCISLVNVRFPSLSQEIFHGSTACWIRMNIWWVWNAYEKTNPKPNEKAPLLTVMVGQHARSLLRSGASLALIVQSMFTSRTQVLPWMCSGYLSTDCDSSLQWFCRSE